MGCAPARGNVHAPACPSPPPEAYRDGSALIFSGQLTQKPRLHYLLPVTPVNRLQFQRHKSALNIGPSAGIILTPSIFTALMTASSVLSRIVTDSMSFPSAPT